MPPSQVYDRPRGDTFFIANAFVVVFAKFVVNIFLWSFAILIVLIGIGYLWFRTRVARSSASVPTSPSNDLGAANAPSQSHCEIR